MATVELTTEQLASVRMTLVFAIKDAVTASTPRVANYVPDYLADDVSALLAVVRQANSLGNTAELTDAEILTEYGIKLPAGVVV